MTAPTLKHPAPPAPADDWSSLEDGTFDDVPAHAWSSSAAGTKPRPDQYARTDVASGLSLGSRASTAKQVNQVAMFKCNACRGSGRFVRGFHNPVDYGPCNKCKGTGKLKTDPEIRAKQKKAREDKKKAEVGAYIVAHINEYTWAVANSTRSNFARSMCEAVNQYGSWTDNQLATIRRFMAEDAVYAEERAKADAAAPKLTGTGFERMVAAFASAKTAGLKYPKLHVGELTFSLAGAQSKYAGRGVFVKLAGEYLGRIDLLTAAWRPTSSCSAELSQRIVEVCKDPLAAAVLHGKQTGHCSCCGRELENEESVRLGIGPICREKWGL